MVLPALLIIPQGTQATRTNQANKQIGLKENYPSRMEQTDLYT